VLGISIGLIFCDLLHWVTFGSTIIGLNLLSMAWTLPKSISQIRPKITEKKARKMVMAVAITVAAGIIAGRILIHLEYYTLIRTVSSSSGNMKIAATEDLLDFSADHKHYLPKACSFVTYIAQSISLDTHYAPTKPMLITPRIVRLAVRYCRDSSELEFRKVKLSGANLVGSDLRGTRFIDSDLDKVDFWKANLANTKFMRCNFSNSKLRNARCTGARFIVVQAKNADCRGCNFTKSYLGWGSWEGSNFSWANLSYSTIRGAALRRVTMRRAKMKKVNARWAIFDGSDLRGVNLTMGDFRNARFRRADLRGSNLSGAILENADFRGADLRNVTGLDSSTLEKIIIDDKTLLSVKK